MEENPQLAANTDLTVGLPESLTINPAAKLPAHEVQPTAVKQKTESTVFIEAAESMRVRLSELRNTYLNPDKFFDALDNFSPRERFLIIKALTSSDVQSNQNPFMYDTDYYLKFGDLASTKEDKKLLGKYKEGVLIEPSKTSTESKNPEYDKECEEIIKDVLLGGQPGDESKKDQYLMNPLIFLILNHSQVLNMSKGQVDYVIEQMQKSAEKKGLILYLPEELEKSEMNLLNRRKMSIAVEPHEPLRVPSDWYKQDDEKTSTPFDLDRIRVDFNTHMILKTILAGDIAVREAGSTEWRRRIR